MHSKPKNDPLLNLADFLVEDILKMSDEEILAECTPQDLEEAAHLKERVLSLLKSRKGTA